MSSHSGDLLRDSGIGLHEVLVLRPGHEGTSVEPASSIQDVRDLLAGGIPMSDAVIPYTKPKGAEQLPLFVD
jgi:hypothetical protein